MNEDISYCKEVCKTYSSTYRNSILFFPKKLRDEVTVLYAFFRLADEIVDNPGDADPIVELDKVIAQWNSSVIEGIAPMDRILRATKEIFTLHSIPYSFGNDFLSGMKEDTVKSRYATYEELEHYMYGSATVVGYILSYVIGYQEGALPYAKKLAEAMQLTNFLRDVQEDYESRGRIYFPLDEMKQFGVTEAMIAAHENTPEVIALTQFQCNRAEQLFIESYIGITMLNARGRIAVYFAHDLYKQILLTIIKKQYKLFTGSYRLTKGQKVRAMMKTVLLTKI